MTMVGSPDQERRRLYLHVGLPKSGTTFLQTLLAGNRDRLTESGYLYPFVRREAMFHAAVELRGQCEKWGLDRSAVEGTWRQLCDKARRFPGTTIISHEILGGADRKQIHAALHELRDFDVHIVVTARDPKRQVTAHWQEQIKNGQTYSFAEFREELLRPGQGVVPDGDFWSEQDLVDVLRRWGTVVSPDHMHVVICPPKGSDRLELWRRFAGVMGIGPDSLDLAVARSGNESLGVAQIALLRQVNAALDGRLIQPTYAHVVKRFFAQQVLSQGHSPRAVVPSAMDEPLNKVAESWIEEIERCGYRTHGALRELLPVEPLEAAAPAPDEVSASEILAGVPDVIANLLVEIAVLRAAQPPGSSLTAASPATPSRGFAGRFARLARRGR